MRLFSILFLPVLLQTRSQFLYFLFLPSRPPLPYIRSSQKRKEKKRKEKVKKKKEGEKYKRDRRDILSKRDITELGIKMVDRWTLSCRHATKPSVYPLKIAMAITTRAFSRVQAAVRRRGKACACKVRTYVRTFIAKIQGDGSPRC